MAMFNSYVSLPQVMTHFVMISLGPIEALVWRCSIQLLAQSATGRPFRKVRNGVQWKQHTCVLFRGIINYPLVI